VAATVYLAWECLAGPPPAAPEKPALAVAAA
jgi:hypothetical protein